MNGRSAGGLALLLIGSLALIGYLTGNLDRWLGFLFSPAATPPASSSTTGSPAAKPTGAAGDALLPYPPGGDARGAYA